MVAIRRLWPIACVLALTFTGCARTSAPVAANEGSPGSASADVSAPAAAVAKASGVALRATGYDTIRIGAAPSAAAGYSLADDGSYDDACRIYASSRLPRVYAIVENGIVMRVTAYADEAGSSTLRTDRGIGVGSTEAEVRAAYSPLREEPHHYVEEPAKDLFFGGSEQDPGLRFEIGADGRVSNLHAGLMPTLGYVEGCS